MNGIDRLLSSGDRIELGDVVESTAEPTRNGVKLIGLHRGEPTEYVVLSTRFSDGEEVSIPEGEVLTVSDGNGRAKPLAWLLVPASEYGGSE